MVVAGGLWLVLLTGIAVYTPLSPSRVLVYGSMVLVTIAMLHFVFMLQNLNLILVEQRHKHQNLLRRHEDALMKALLTLIGTVIGYGIKAWLDSR
jgi:hypothetical protein